MSFVQKLLLQTSLPIREFRRFRGKINIQRPRKPRFLKQLLIDVCKPIYPSTKGTSSTPGLGHCRNLGERSPKIDNPFERILAKECLNWFSHSRMVAFFHENSVTMEYKLPVFANLKMENMHMRKYGKDIIKLALTGTNFEEVRKVFVADVQIVFSEEVQVKNLLKIMKKIPQLILIAGIVDGQLVSRNEFLAYAELPSLDVSRALLCQTFQSGALNLVRQMTQHQLALVSNLDRYVEIENKCSQEMANEGVKGEEKVDEEPSTTV